MKTTSLSLITEPPSIPRNWEALPPALRGRTARMRARVRRASRALEQLSVELGPVLRRLIDILAVGLGLVLVSPLLLVTALAIKLDSRGPVLFRQERVGQHGRPFQILKLRTMRVGADAEKARLATQVPGAVDGGRFKLRVDPRTTRVGRVLRKYSIDELPQLWNVVRGDMTLVGPRPTLWIEVAKYRARELRRLEVRPGLTCLWQVEGRSDLSFEQQVSLDLEYIDRVTPRQELHILARTIPAVLTGRGAY
ncbi:sugar transferase [Corallococcus aberystwythensis]|uniref:Sugar transferase n=1 Tax=Corallococcus aberystwythensis TaxID=2316722 RepID=A0A3A8QN59_9BACT|nr:sugar transferase [Corallococcus aberystwythensis]RKH70113.1 sugar transferase [Corallococcus aberystwythensis]